MTLDDIKQELDSGDVGFIAETTGYSKEMVRKVISGDRVNSDILLATQILVSGKKSLREQISIMLND